MPEKCAGANVALLTPLLHSGAIDFDGLAALAQWLLSSGCNGLVLFGTTGEAASFSLEERENALEEVLSRGIPADHLVVGTGCCAVPDTIRLTRHAVDRGCTGVPLVPPFYFKDVTDDGLFSAYAAVIDGVANFDLRIYLYNIPQISGVSISQNLIGRLLKTYPVQITGIKDSCGELDNILGIIRRFPELTVLSGDDHLMLPVLQAGGAGAVSALGNLVPHALQSIYTNWRNENDDLQRTQKAVEYLWADVLLKYPVTEALKEILAARTGNAGWLIMRPPLSRLTQHQRESLLRAFDDSGFEVSTRHKTMLSEG